MKTFDVYQHPIRGYVAVKSGFSWPAFFFTWIWAFTKKLWGAGLIYLVLFLISNLLYSIFDGLHAEHKADQSYILLMVVTVLFQIGLVISIGAKGNDWRCNALSKRGYKHIELVHASSPDGAIATIVNSTQVHLMKAA